MSEPTPTPEPTPVYDKDFVEKLMAEKKNAMKAVEELKGKIGSYEGKFKEIEEKSLKEKEDWKALAENRQKEIIDWQARYTSLDTKLQQGAKFSAVKREFEKMGVRDPKTIDTLLGIIKPEHIRYDSETQTVIGAEDEARRIKDSLPMVFTQAASKMSHENPQGTTETFSAEKLREMVKNKAPIADVRKYQEGLMRGLVK